MTEDANSCNCGHLVSRRGLLRGGGAGMIALGGVLLGANAAKAAPGGLRTPVEGQSTAGLVPLLALAYNAAHADAQRQGVPMWIVSGFRTHAEQQQLWNDGLREYGGPEQTRKFVAYPGTSAHERGQAIDVGPRAGAAWLEANGVRYGLTRRYQNEWWHFELTTFPGIPGPPLLPNAAG